MSIYGELLRGTSAVANWRSIAIALACCTAAPSAAEEPEVGVPAVIPGPGPFVIQTAEQPKVSATLIASGLSHIYRLAFLPEDNALIVERGARLRLLRHATRQKPELEPAPIAGIPDYSSVEHATAADMLGIQDVIPDPDFQTNRVLFLSYNRPVGYDPVAQRITAATVVARATLDGLHLTGMREILVGEAQIDVGASRLSIGKTGELFVAVSGLNKNDEKASQRLDTIYGKVLKISRDGSIPSDNPFIRTKGARQEIWAYGLRDAQGMAFDPRSGRLIAVDHGPQGGDEVNDLLSGRNYGWPSSTYGTDYEGSPLSSTPVLPSTKAPMQIWSPGIAPSGIAFYTGQALPGWRGNLFVASARRGQINGTGGIVRVVFNDRLQEVRQELLFGELHQRFKDIAQGPDGLLYAATDEDKAVILRIGPADGRDASPSVKQ